MLKTVLFLHIYADKQKDGMSLANDDCLIIKDVALLIVNVIPIVSPITNECFLMPRGASETLKLSVKSILKQWREINQTIFLYPLSMDGDVCRAQSR